MPRPARRIGTTSGWGAASLTPVVGADRRDDVDRLDPHVAGGLVGQQRDQLVGQPAERRGVGVLVAQGGELVGDERVVDDVGAHGRNPSGSAARLRPRPGNRGWPQAAARLPLLKATDGRPRRGSEGEPWPSTIDGVDFALAAYREEGVWQVQELAHDVLGDVDALAHALRRFPGDGGAVGHGRHRRGLLRDRPGRRRRRPACCSPTSPPPTSGSSPAPRSTHLGLPLPEDEDDQVPGRRPRHRSATSAWRAMDMGVLLDDVDLYPDEMLSDVARRLGFGALFDEAVGLTSA